MWVFRVDGGKWHIRTRVWSGQDRQEADTACSRTIEGPRKRFSHAYVLDASPAEITPDQFCKHCARQVAALYKMAVEG